MSPRAWIKIPAVLLFLGIGGPVAGQTRKAAGPPGEWPQWRGMLRDGSVQAPLPEGGWPEQAIRLWSRDVGDGYSGPIVRDGKVWVHARRREQELVSALSLASGETLWTTGYEAPFRQDDSARGHGRGPYSTPTISDGRLFTYGVTGVLSAWHAATGGLLWRRESGKEFGLNFPFFGATASPLVWEQLCFIHLGGHDRSNPDGPDKGAMVALRVADGREEWRWAGDAPPVGASPVICHMAGSIQLVFKTKRKIVGLDPRTGRELWQLAYKVPMYNTIVTPLIVGDLLLTSDYEIGMGAWQIRPSGGSWTVQPLWQTREISLFINSPVLIGDRLFGFSHLRRGQLFALDPADGSVKWRGNPRGGEHATLISWENYLLVFGEDGCLAVWEVAPNGVQPVQRYRLGDAICWAHPAIVDGRILVRDGSRLAAFRLGRP